MQESISTCRFAQRVALIKNDVMLNEELDPKLMIQKLKREILQLKEELAMATGEQRTDDLSAEDLERLVDLQLVGHLFVGWEAMGSIPTQMHQQFHLKKLGIASPMSSKEM